MIVIKKILDAIDELRIRNSQDGRHFIYSMGYENALTDVRYRLLKLENEKEDNGNSQGNCCFERNRKLFEKTKKQVKKCTGNK